MAGNSELLPVHQDLAAYDPDVARKLKSIESAIIFQRIICSINEHIEHRNRRFFKDGRWWMSETIQEFIEHSGLGRSQVLLAIKKLKASHFIVVANYDKESWDRRNYYSVGEVTHG